MYTDPVPLVVTLISLQSIAGGGCCQLSLTASHSDVSQMSLLKS